MKEHALRPIPVSGLETSSKESIHYYDPTFTLNQDLFDTKENLLIKAGTRVNPFDYQDLNEVLLFINADDASQVKWALAQKEQFDFSKIILVSGEYQRGFSERSFGQGLL